MEFRKIKDYEITVEDGIVTNIVKNGYSGRVTAYPYKRGVYGGWVIQNNVKFTTLKNGIYRGTYQVF